jgi:hypothetical protein
MRKTVPSGSDKSGRGAAPAAPLATRIDRGVNALVPFVQAWRLPLNPEDLSELAQAVLAHADSDESFDVVQEAVREQIEDARQMHESLSQARAAGLGAMNIDQRVMSLSQRHGRGEDGAKIVIETASDMETSWRVTVVPPEGEEMQSHWEGALSVALDDVEGKS